MYVYIQSEHSSEHNLYTVGFYKPDGDWDPESDHSTSEEAAKRCHYLNGGNDDSVKDAIKDLYDKIYALDTK